jgi:hypothetical protein
MERERLTRRGPLRQVVDRVRLASLLQVLSLFALCLGFMEARTHPRPDSSPACMLHLRLARRAAAGVTEREGP